MFTDEQLDWLEQLDGDELCAICSANDECGGNGVQGGPNGPLYPPCADQSRRDLVDYESAIDAFHQSFCNACRGRTCTGCEHQH